MDVMKKIYIFLSLLIIGISSCSDLTEEILDEKNNFDVVTDTANVEMLVTPAYVFLRDLQSRSAGWLVQETSTDPFLHMFILLLTVTLKIHGIATS